MTILRRLVCNLLLVALAPSVVACNEYGPSTPLLSPPAATATGTRGLTPSPAATASPAATSLPPSPTAPPPTSTPLVNTDPQEADGGQLAYLLGDGRLLLASSASDAPELLLTDVGAAGWAPDGSRLAFIRDGALFLMDATTAESRRLLADDGRQLDDPRWAPDGRRLALQVTATTGCTGDCPSRIAVLELEGSELLPLTSGPDTETHTRPRWAPDGQQLLYVARSGPFADAFYVVDLEGNSELLLDVGDVTGDVEWAPGRQLAYSRGFEDEAALYLLDPAGDGSPRRVDNGAFSDLAWSPDGQRLAYVRFFEQTLHILQPGAAPSPALVAGLGMLFAPTWSPDGLTLAFAAVAGESINLYTYPLTGEEPQLITAQTGGADAIHSLNLYWPPPID